MLKQRRVFEITKAQIWLTLLIAAIALTAVFEIGVHTGKKQVIEAELESEQQNNAKVLADTRKLPSIPNSDRRDVKNNARTPNSDNPQSPLPERTTEEKETQYTIKVGTFSSYQNAKKLVNKLKSAGYDSWLKSDPGTGKVAYHVFAGRFDTTDKAKQFGKSLQNKLPYITNYVVREIEP